MIQNAARTLMTLMTMISLSSVILISAFVTGCGFKLRGPYQIPETLRILRIAPDDPYDPFQRVLRRNLKSLGIQLYEGPVDTPLGQQASLLTIISQTIADRTTGYGPDVQINRTLKQYSMSYQITDCSGKVLIPATGIQVERELTVNPNAVLGTQFESNLVRDELYQDAIQQLLRQLSGNAN